MAVSPAARSRLETQGFVGLDDDSLSEVEPWLRFTPGLCTALIVVGTALALPVMLWVIAAIALVGAVFPVHPFDLLYNYGIRNLTGTRPLPQNGPPRRFACGMASVWLLATGIAFQAEVDALGYVLGGVLAGVASVVALTHFCVPSTIYCAIFGRPRAGAA